MRLVAYVLAILAMVGLAAPPALAQTVSPPAITYGTLSQLCDTNRVECRKTQPVSNADGTAIGSGIVTPSSLVGSLTFTTAAGAPKRVARNGQAPLQINVVPYVATDSGARYYALTGGNNLLITLTNYTSGSVTVTINATGQALYPIPIGELQTSALVALLNGRGFTGGFPGGTLNVPNNNVACLTIANPAGSGVRAIFEARLFSTDVITGQRPPRYYVINNATTGLPTNTATVNNRGGGGTSPMVLTYGSMSALPTGGSTALGGYVPTGGIAYSPPLEKTLEPGNNTTMCVLGQSATGVATDTSSPSIIYGWRDQATN